MRDVHGCKAIAGRGLRRGAGAGVVVSGCRTGAIFVSSVWSGERMHTLDATQDSVWVLRSILGSPDHTGAASFVVAAASRCSQGSVFCGSVEADGTVVHGGPRSDPALPARVLRGHTMALLCMDVTWLQAREAWPEAGRCDRGTPDQTPVDLEMAAVALGSAGAARSPAPLPHAPSVPPTPQRAARSHGQCGGVVEVECGVGADSTVSVWEATSGRRLAVLERRHKVGILCVQFHRAGCHVDRNDTPVLQPNMHTPDASKPQLLLLSGGADHVVCLWDVMRSACLQQLPCHAAPVTSIQAAGETVVTIAGVERDMTRAPVDLRLYVSAEQLLRWIDCCCWKPHAIT